MIELSKKIHMSKKHIFCFQYRSNNDREASKSTDLFSVILFLPGGHNLVRRNIINNIPISYIVDQIISRLLHLTYRVIFNWELPLLIIALCKQLNAIFVLANRYEFQNIWFINDIITSNWISLIMKCKQYDNS